MVTTSFIALKLFCVCYRRLARGLVTRLTLTGYLGVGKELIQKAGVEYPPSSLANPSLGCPGMVTQNSRVPMTSLPHILVYKSYPHLTLYVQIPLVVSLFST